MSSATAFLRFEAPAPAEPRAAATGVSASLFRGSDPGLPRAGEWAELAAQASEPNAFAERWFLAPSLAHLACDGDVRLVVARSGGRLIGLMPVRIAPRYGRMPVRHVENWLHFHSFLGAPLVRAGCEQAFWTAVLRLLDEEPWAETFLHINGLVEHGPVHRGLAAAAWVERRSCDTVHRTLRALLHGPLAAQDYYETHVRKKKRKELKRLRARLAELGSLTFRTLEAEADLDSWCDAFLTLEGAGWKGSNGSALRCSSEVEAFFREAVAGAFASGRLEFIRLDLDGKPLAMLVNFMTLPGSFSFKIAFDEDYARFSPGVLLQIENLRLLDRPGFQWMDSCAVEDHPMINSLWADRRPIVRVTVPLRGARRQALFRLCRTAETLSAAWRNRRAGRATSIPSCTAEEDDD